MDQIAQQLKLFAGWLLEQAAILAKQWQEWNEIKGKNQAQKL